MLEAFQRASESIKRFQELVVTNSPGIKYAKLRFRDPEESERLGKDQFLFLWLTDIHFHKQENIFSGTFFEVPVEFQKWHQVGKRLGFELTDVFDWMVNNNGLVIGGFTLRVTRESLPSHERTQYDNYIGIKTYEPI